MKQSTTDQVEGTAHVVKGAVKETVGNLTNDPKRTVEGQNEQVLGHVQKKVGEIEKVVGA